MFKPWPGLFLYNNFWSEEIVSSLRHCKYLFLEQAAFPIQKTYCNFVLLLKARKYLYSYSGEIILHGVTNLAIYASLYRNIFKQNLQNWLSSCSNIKWKSSNNTLIDGCCSFGRINCSLVTPVNIQRHSDGY